MYLGCYSKLVRGHQKVNKRYPNRYASSDNRNQANNYSRDNNTLDILEELRLKDLDQDEESMVRLLSERLGEVVDHVQDEDVKYLISFNNDTESIDISLA